VITTSARAVYVNVYDDGVLIGRVKRVGRPWQAWGRLVAHDFTFLGWAASRADAVAMVVGREPVGRHRFEGAS
jgi:hypothetical protein